MRNEEFPPALPDGAEGKGEEGQRGEGIVPVSLFSSASSGRVGGNV